MRRNVYLDPVLRRLVAGLDYQQHFTNEVLIQPHPNGIIPIVRQTSDAAFTGVAGPPADVMGWGLNVRRLILGAFLLLSGCGPSREELQNRITELEDENSQLRAQLDDARQKADDASDAAASAKSAAD